MRALQAKLLVYFSLLCAGALALCLGAAMAILGEWQGPGGGQAALWIALIALVTFLLASGLAVVLIRRAVGPVGELQRLLRAAARERYRQPVALPVDEELAEIAEEFERLRVELQRLTAENAAEVERLLDLSRLPGMVDPRKGEEAAARAALDAVVRAVGGRGGALYLRDQEGVSLQMVAAAELRAALSDEARTVPVSHGFMGRVFNWGQALVLDEEAAGAWLHEVWEDTAEPAAVVCVPLKSGGETFGVLNIVLRPESPLTPEQVDMLETIAAQIGATLANAQVYGAARRRLRHIAALLDTSAEVARGRRTRQVLDLVLAKLRELTGAEKCAVLLRAEEAETYRVATHAGLSQAFVARAAELAPQGPTGRAVRELRPVTVNSISLEPAAAELFVPYREEGIESVLAVPLLGGENTYGAVELYRSHRGGFSREETQLLAILANQAAIALTNAQLYEQSTRRLTALETLVETIALFGASSDPRQIVQTAVRKVREVFHCRTCHVCLRDPETGLLRLEGGVGLGAEEEAELTHGLEGGQCWAVQKGSAFVVRDAEWDLTCEQKLCAGSDGSYACAPLTAGGECFGVMHMGSAKRRAFTAEEVQLFGTIAEQVAIAAQRAQLFQQVQELATTDPMTGAHNYRRFREQLERELNEAKRYERPLSLILMDLDHFKEHNDTFGHPSGDEVLRKLAQVIRQCLRNVDFFARYGGEEFVVVLPETVKEGARAVAEKIREEVAAAEFYGDPETPVVHKTLSLGVASFPEDGETDEALVAASDRALYRAKEGGRNCVMPAGEEA